MSSEFIEMSLLLINIKLMVEIGKKQTHQDHIFSRVIGRLEGRLQTLFTFTVFVQCSFQYNIRSQFRPRFVFTSKVSFSFINFVISSVEDFEFDSSHRELFPEI